LILSEDKHNKQLSLPPRSKDLDYNAQLVIIRTTGYKKYYSTNVWIHSIIGQKVWQQLMTTHYGGVHCHLHQL